MSTRAIYHFHDKRSGETYHVYKHYDNYPHGAIQFIEAAITKAWLFPRYEADEFAAAFIAANKDGAGGVRMVPVGCDDMGQDYDYWIGFDEIKGELKIGFVDLNDEGKRIEFIGTLEDMKKYVEKNYNEN